MRHEAKNKLKAKNWWYGSSTRALAQQVLGPEFNTQYLQKIKIYKKRAYKIQSMSKNSLCDQDIGAW